ncbi:hypothetical protein PPACK8108_LOCUS24923 [Phakopsora pachyrhizi]|uniref:Glycosyl hydrolase family 63 N-terminal domain-containing protein n=1 Tax=Phakopsora pachyrhizi TaxID=170000 RepID=A0AAV0BSR1_PHAPC|nr:hypothetical protein PPACK8108_LOCUS24923 [Phakopsora pachyrhizi]
MMIQLQHTNGPAPSYAIESDSEDDKWFDDLNNSHRNQHQDDLSKRSLSWEPRIPSPKRLGRASDLTVLLGNAGRLVENGFEDQDIFRNGSLLRLEKRITLSERGKRMNWLRRRHLFVSIVLLLKILKISTVSPSDDQHKAQKILNGDREGPESYQAVSKATNQSLLWGTYRPNLYFGLKPHQPNSLMTGSRHTCEQGDELGGYGYDKHDA